MNTEEKKRYKTDRYCGWGDEKDKKEEEMSNNNIKETKEDVRKELIESPLKDSF